MKPTKSLRILTPVIMALFILSLFTGIVVAQAPAGEQYEKASKQDKINKENFDKTEKQFKDAEKLLLEANKQAKNDKSGDKSEVLMERARDYIIKAEVKNQRILLVLMESRCFTT